MPESILDLSDHLMFAPMTVDLGPHSLREWTVRCTGCDWHCHLRSGDRVDSKAAFESHLKLITRRVEVWKDLLENAVERSRDQTGEHADFLRGILEELNPDETISRVRFMRALADFAESVLVHGDHYWLSKTLPVLGVSVRPKTVPRPATMDDLHWVAGTGRYAQ